MANREEPEPADRDRLPWRRIPAREKFIWRSGDIRLIHPVKDKDAPGRASGDPRKDDGRPGTRRS